MVYFFLLQKFMAMTNFSKTDTQFLQCIQLFCIYREICTTTFKGEIIWLKKTFFPKSLTSSTTYTWIRGICEIKHTVQIFLKVELFKHHYPQLKIYNVLTSQNQIEKNFIKMCPSFIFFWTVILEFKSLNFSKELNSKSFCFNLRFFLFSIFANSTQSFQKNPDHRTHMSPTTETLKVKMQIFILKFTFFRNFQFCVWVRFWKFSIVWHKPWLIIQS